MYKAIKIVLSGSEEHAILLCLTFLLLLIFIDKMTLNRTFII